jgi:hypothetical protein
VLANLYQACIGISLGTLLCSGFFVAPTAFKVLNKPGIEGGTKLAGAIAGKVFIFSYTTTIVLCLIAIALYVTYSIQESEWRFLRMTLLILGILFLVVVLTVFLPIIQSGPPAVKTGTNWFAIAHAGASVIHIATTLLLLWAVIIGLYRN